MYLFDRSLTVKNVLMVHGSNQQIRESDLVQDDHAVPNSLYLCKCTSIPVPSLQYYLLIVRNTLNKQYIIVYNN